MVTWFNCDNYLDIVVNLRTMRQKHVSFDDKNPLGAILLRIFLSQVAYLCLRNKGMNKIDLCRDVKKVFNENFSIPPFCH